MKKKTVIYMFVFLLGSIFSVGLLWFFDPTFLKTPLTVVVSFLVGGFLTLNGFKIVNKK